MIKYEREEQLLNVPNHLPMEKIVAGHIPSATGSTLTLDLISYLHGRF